MVVVFGRHKLEGGEFRIDGFFGEILWVLHFNNLAHIGLAEGWKNRTFDQNKSH